MRFVYSDQNENKGMSKLLGSVIFFIGIIVVFVICLSTFSEGTNAKEREILEKALSQDISFCYAMEGKYPESLEYIKDKYSLVYDEDKFYIDYRTYGSNIRPDVTIIDIK